MPFLSELVKQVYAELANRMKLKVPPGLTTGVAILDEAIGGGWIRQQLSYLVGDSGIGKSWLASSFVLRGAQWLFDNPESRPPSGYILTGEAVDDVTRQAVLDKENKPPIIVFWSLEMAESPIVVRLLTQLAQELYHIRLDSGKLLRGNIGAEPDSEEWIKRCAMFLNIYQKVQTDYGKHIYMEFEAHSTAEFCNILDELAAAYDICLVVVDYFFLIDEVAMDGNLTTLQAERSRKLRAIAREYDCHVLSIFNVTRDAEKAIKAGHGVDTQHMFGGTAAKYDADNVLGAGLIDDTKNEDGLRTTPDGHLVLWLRKARHSIQKRIDLYINLATGYVEPWHVPPDARLARGQEWSET